MAAAAGGDDNVVHLNVQKQVIMAGGGVKVQVVRLVQVGQPHKQVDIAGQLKMLADATGQLIAEGEAQGGTGADADENDKGPGEEDDPNDVSF